MNTRETNTPQVQVLVATMRKSQAEVLQLVESMGLHESPFIIVNQGVSENSSFTKDPHQIVVNDTGLGLSKSRNTAIAVATCEICVVADDDMQYSPQQLMAVAKAFDEHPEADILIFNVELPDGKFYKRKHNNKPFRFHHAFQVSSVQIAFKRAAVKSVGLRFDESFGLGTPNHMTEENIFIADALRAGLVVGWSAATVGVLLDSESTGFRSYSPDLLNAKGRGLFRVSPLLALPFALYFSVTKSQLFPGLWSKVRAFYFLVRGIIQQVFVPYRP